MNTLLLFIVFDNSNILTKIMYLTKFLIKHVMTNHVVITQECPVLSLRKDLFLWKSFAPQFTNELQPNLWTTNLSYGASKIVVLLLGHINLS